MERSHKLLPAIIMAADGTRYSLENGYLFEDGTEILTVYGNENNYPNSGEAYVLKNREILEGPEWIDTARNTIKEIYCDYVGRTITEWKERKAVVVYLSKAEEYEEEGTEFTSEEYNLRNKINEIRNRLIAEKGEAERALEAWNSIHWNTKKDGTPFSVVSRNCPESVRLYDNDIWVWYGTFNGHRENFNYHVYSSCDYTLDTFEGVLKAVEAAKEEARRTIETNSKKLEKLDEEYKAAAELMKPLDALLTASVCKYEVKKLLSQTFDNYDYRY